MCTISMTIYELEKLCRYHKIRVGGLINIYTEMLSTAMAVEYDDQKLKLSGWFVDEGVRAFDVAAAASAFLSTGSCAFSYVSLFPTFESFC